jgi:hypothetical protein
MALLVLEHRFCLLNGIAAEILFVCHAEPVEAFCRVNVSIG